MKERNISDDLRLGEKPDRKLGNAIREAHHYCKEIERETPSKLGVHKLGHRRRNSEEMNKKNGVKSDRRKHSILKK